MAEREGSGDPLSLPPLPPVKSAEEIKLDLLKDAIFDLIWAIRNDSTGELDDIETELNDGWFRALRRR